jgi:hypothetical protein
VDNQPAKADPRPPRRIGGVVLRKSRPELAEPGLTIP